MFWILKQLVTFNFISLCACFMLSWHFCAECCNNVRSIFPCMNGNLGNQEIISPLSFCLFPFSYNVSTFQIYKSVLRTLLPTAIRSTITDQSTIVVWRNHHRKKIPFQLSQWLTRCDNRHFIVNTKRGRSSWAPAVARAHEDFPLFCIEAMRIYADSS